MYSVWDTCCQVGFPIRKSTDQSLLAAPHGLSQRATSFIASQCQGIHQMPLRRLIHPLRSRAGTSPHSANHNEQLLFRFPVVPGGTESLPSRLRGSLPCKAEPIRSHFTKPFSRCPRTGSPCCLQSPFQATDLLLPMDLSTALTQHPSQDGDWWRRTGSNRRPHACKARALPTELRPQFCGDPNDQSPMLISTRLDHLIHEKGCGDGGPTSKGVPNKLGMRPKGRFFLRKEVIQPQVPLRLPCYDFTPVADRTVVGCLLAVSAPASGKANSHGVTGGVYKARERIHRGVLIRDY